MADVIKKITTKESTSSTQTTIVDLPKLKEVYSVVPNTGTATFTPVAGNEEQISIVTKGGTYTRRTRHDYWVPGDSKIESDSRYAYYRNYMRWTGTYWTVDPSGSGDNIPPPGSVWYDSGGYSGTLYSTGDSYFRDNSEPEPSNPTLGQLWLEADYTWSYKYEGEVTKPGYDDYYYNYYYQYNITISYKEKGIDLHVLIGGVPRPAYDGWVKVDGETQPIDLMNMIINGEIKEGL